MTFSGFPILADENIHPKLIALLQQERFDIIPVSGSPLAGQSDLVLLEVAYPEKRIIMTQDSDFGKLIFTRNIPFIGIVYLRPGHFEAEFHITTLKAIIASKLELTTPFILVAENNRTVITLRLRQF